MDRGIGRRCWLAGLYLLAASLPVAAGPAWLPEATAGLETELVARHGEGQRARAARGLSQVAALWREEDGDRAVFEAFVRANFAGDQPTVDLLFERFETNLEALDGHLHEINVAFRLQSDLDRGPVRPWDSAFAAWDPAAHVNDDFFASKLAFTALLNFPLTTLGERLEEGPGWSRRQWAETRLAERFSIRVPAAVARAVASAAARARAYIDGYNIWMHHLVDDRGERLFPAGMKLLTHWNLRDQIRADYADGQRGLERQRMIQRVMERIVEQTVPAVVIDNPLVDWNPWTNEVRPAAVRDSGHTAPESPVVSSEPEGDARYAAILGNFHAALQRDRYDPAAPTEMARSFDRGRELPEARVREMFEAVLSSPLFVEVGALVAARLGRPLEPFDIWYDGFRAGDAQPQDELDALTRQRYPDAASYEADIPRQLVGLGFAPERAAAIAAGIVVQPARGSGHAWGAQMRGAPTRLRTRVGPDGMDYKGYNIAIHELGHNVEQIISLEDIDYYSLEGVPNSAFTEALAFVFQSRDLELLGLAQPTAESRALAVLDEFWSTAEIAGVALVEMDVWRWLYAHPDATPAALKAATLGIARDVWNRYFATVFDRRDAILLGVYSHMVERNLYLSNYPLGGMIARQIEEQVDRSGALGAEFERMARIGRVTPDLWLQIATGAPVGPEALLRAAARSLVVLKAGEAGAGG